MKKNRLHELFNRKKQYLLSVFYTAGFPKLDDTKLIAEALERSGADLIEIGIPFSDPVADGPTIQQSNKIALENGIHVGLILQHVAAIRQTVKLPIILMGYLNPVMQYGVERFAHDAAAAGVDGLILPDMPIPEYEREYKRLFDDLGLSLTFLVSPTTLEERIRKIDALSNSFIYAVSASSTTGARTGFANEQLQYFERLKNLKLRNPFLIGFGISNHETFSQAAQYGAGAIVGSAFVNKLMNTKNIDMDVEGFVRELKGSLI